MINGWDNVTKSYFDKAQGCSMAIMPAYFYLLCYGELLITSIYT